MVSVNGPLISCLNVTFLPGAMFLIYETVVGLIGGNVRFLCSVYTKRAGFLFQCCGLRPIGGFHE